MQVVVLCVWRRLSMLQMWLCWTDFQVSIVRKTSESGKFFIKGLKTKQPDCSPHKDWEEISSCPTAKSAWVSIYSRGWRAGHAWCVSVKLFLFSRRVGSEASGPRSLKRGHRVKSCSNNPDPNAQIPNYWFLIWTFSYALQNTRKPIWGDLIGSCDKKNSLRKKDNLVVFVWISFFFWGGGSNYITDLIKKIMWNFDSL